MLEQLVGAAERLAQGDHDRLFNLAEGRGCLHQVKHDRGHAAAGDYLQFRCELCGWVGRVGGKRALAENIRSAG